jgi:hypothetical protein
MAAVTFPILQHCYKPAKPYPDFPFFAHATGQPVKGTGTRTDCGTESRVDCGRERATGIIAVLRSCASGIATLLGKLCATIVRHKTAAVPIVHEEVVLSEEGAKVWEEVSNPASPVGKPVHHCRRRLPDGDLPR